MEQFIDFRDIANLESFSSAFCKMQDSYVLVNVTADGSGHLDIDDIPKKFQGIMMMLVRNGSPFNLEIDQQLVNVTPDTLVMVSPGSVVRFIGKLPANLDMWVLYLDMTFLENINFNLSAIPLPTKHNHPRRSMLLDADEALVMSRFFELINLTTSTEHEDSQLGKCVSTSIIAAMLYQMIQYYYKRIAEIIDYETDSQKSVRRNDYVREFIRLLRSNYIKERAVAFYADKLFISPKYLSLLVKESTGRSAAKWIDDFVITEAKNMLRYSGKNVQQVAYALNFPTQSSFGKYFKHLTGMSPTEYQRS